jgi:hypothetical protein
MMCSPRVATQATRSATDISGERSAPPGYPPVTPTVSTSQRQPRCCDCGGPAVSYHWSDCYGPSVSAIRNANNVRLSGPATPPGEKGIAASRPSRSPGPSTPSPTTYSADRFRAQSALRSTPARSRCADIARIGDRTGSASWWCSDGSDHSGREIQAPGANHGGGFGPHHRLTIRRHARPPAVGHRDFH